MDVSEGQVLAGKYRVERVLGRGGMGVVVAAMHLQLGERVALKFLLPEAIPNPDAVVRFDREARAAVRIKSEHVARVSDVGRLDDGAPYMVMEYLQGIDLSAWLVQRGPLSIEQAVEFVLQGCEAIAEAHTLGIVHRDLKPANLFVVERPDGALAVKVLDFGISKSMATSASDAGITKTTAAMGSPLYMSPEQMESARDVDLRGDVWALGVVLYELISARVPFPGESIAELVLKVVTRPPVALRSVCPHVPAGLEAVINKCLQKDRNARYQTVAELAAALLEFAPRRSRTSVERIERLTQRAGMAPTVTHLSPSPDALGPPSVHPAPQTLASWGQTSPVKNDRRRAALIASTLIGVILLAAGAAALLHYRGRSGETASASAVAPTMAASVATAPDTGAASSAAAFTNDPAPAPAVAASAEPAAGERAVSLAASSASSASPPGKQPHGPKQTSTLTVSKTPPVGQDRNQATRSEPPAKAIVKPGPSSANNPLKMTIQ